MYVVGTDVRRVCIDPALRQEILGRKSTKGSRLGVNHNTPRTRSSDSLRQEAPQGLVCDTAKEPFASPLRWISSARRSAKPTQFGSHAFCAANGLPSMF